MGLFECQIVNTRYVHDHTLTELGLLDSFNLMLDGVGWRGLMGGHWDTYLALVLEFFSSIELVVVRGDNQNSTSRALCFRLGNVERRMNMNHFNEIYGLPRDG